MRCVRSLLSFIMITTSMYTLKNLGVELRDLLSVKCIRLIEFFVISGCWRQKRKILRLQSLNDYLHSNFIVTHIITSFPR